MKKLSVKLVGVVLALSLTTGCGALHTAVNKSRIDVQTKMSASIFLDPVSPEQQTVMIQIRNTSDKPDFDIAEQVKDVITAKGYTIVQDPAKAHYLLQANVLRVGRCDAREAEHAMTGSYGSAIAGAVAGGAALGAMTGSDTGMIAGSLLGAAVSTIFNAAVKDVYYTVIVDLQISERAAQGVEVIEEADTKLKQGTSGYKKQSVVEVTDWKRYQTRIVAVANKVNLKFPTAAPYLVSGVARSIAGIL